MQSWPEKITMNKPLMRLEDLADETQDDVEEDKKEETLKRSCLNVKNIFNTFMY